MSLQAKDSEWKTASLFRLVQTNRIDKRPDLALSRNHFNFFLIFYVTSYAVRVLAQWLLKRKLQIQSKYLASQMYINNIDVSCCYFSTSFCSANLNFRLRPKLGRKISLWTERKDRAKD